MSAKMIAVLFALGTIWYTKQSDAIPLNSQGAVWHQIAKRDTSAVPPPSNENNSSKTNDEKNSAAEEKTIMNDEDTGTDMDIAQIDEQKALPDADRSIDWQFLTGNPAELERELETRRRRRSVRSSLSRQHRIRTTGVGRSRSKRGTEYEVITPSDLAMAYSYLQRRAEERREQDVEPNENDLANLASIIYDLKQRPDNDNDDDNGYDQAVLPDEYTEEIQPTNYYPTEIRLSPEQLATLERALSEQQDENSDERDYYPKDKRSADLDEDVDASPTFMLSTPVDPSNRYVQIPIITSYENPYDSYQVDDTNTNEDLLRRLDEEQLRLRIANLIDDINQQRQYTRRR